MSFARILERLRDAASDRPLDRRQGGRGQTRVVDASDLRELLHHFDRLDAEIRASYRKNQEKT